MLILNQAAIGPSVLTLPALSGAAKYRPFAAKVLTWAGVAADATTIDRARAVVGWVAAHALHPSTALHPSGYAVHTDVLPAGESWATFNAAFDNATAITADNAFWYGLYPNGGAMLEALVGTIAGDGSVTDNGMLTEDSTDHWQLRNFAGFHAPQCTLQCKIAQVLLGALGILSTDISTLNHDPMVFFDPDSARWLYIDPTWGEMQRAAGDYLTPLDLVAISIAGNAATITGEKLLPYAYPDDTFFTGGRLPTGMPYMSMYGAPQWSGGISARTPYRFGNVPSQSATGDISAPASQIMPQYGCGFAGIQTIGQQVEVSLRSSWPNATGFERSDDDGSNWNSVGALDYVAVGSGTHRYRSVDGDGFGGIEASMGA